MQRLYPEGLVFVNVLYGISWCEIGSRSRNPSIKKKALEEALFAYNQINSPKAKATYEKNIKPFIIPVSKPSGFFTGTAEV